MANEAGISVKPLDYTAANAPTTKTYHGAAIIVNDNIVGRVQSWNVSGAYDREVKHVYELNNSTWGVPIDIVPGISSGFTISMARVEVWSQELELALGWGSVWDNLSDQDRPFTIFEYLYKGADLYRAWKYNGCWFTSKNESEYSAEGDGKITVQGAITYLNRTKYV